MTSKLIWNCVTLLRLFFDTYLMLRSYILRVHRKTCQGYNTLHSLIRVISASSKISNIHTAPSFEPEDVVASLGRRQVTQSTQEKCAQTQSLP